MEANDATEDEVKTETVEDIVKEYMEVKKEKVAIAAKFENVKQRLTERYYEETDFEGQVVQTERFDVTVADQSRTGIWSKNLFLKKYGDKWMKEHLNTTYHPRLSVSKKKL